MPPRPTYHAGKQLPVVIAGHPSGAVELKPAVLAGSHAQQARVDLRQRRALGQSRAPVMTEAQDPRAPAPKARLSPTLMLQESVQPALAQTRPAFS